MRSPLNQDAIAPTPDMDECSERHRVIEALLDEIVTTLRRVEARLAQSPAPSPANDPTVAADTAGEPEWVTARQVARQFGISVKALYSDVERGGRFADAASRVGKRLRFSRRGLDRLPLRKPGRRSHLQERVPSPGGSERW